jgi:predicted NBD/HSP70 family sugar kinase
MALSLDPLHLRLERHARHPRARKWVVEFIFGHGHAADRRTYTLWAPSSASRDVMLRVHNGMLLLHPAAVRIEAPVETDRVRGLDDLRALHTVPVVLDDTAPLPLPAEGLDLPAHDFPERARPERGTVSVGLDIGGTGMKCVALDDGVVFARASSPTWPEGAHGIDSLVERSRALIYQVAQGRPIGSLGIGFASPMGVRGQVVSLSTVMRERLGHVDVLQDFPERLAKDLTTGPVACFNDLANLGRHLSGKKRRKVLRLQIGTSFGGCWIDADGTVAPAELGRLVVDAGPSARPHTYLPLAGAMKSYLSGLGVGMALQELVGRPVSAWRSGYLLAELLAVQAPEAGRVIAWMADLLVGVIAETRGFLPGLREVEIGGSMLQGTAGRRLLAGVRERLGGVAEVSIARDPGYDGAIAAAHAPLIGAPLRGLARL